MVGGAVKTYTTCSGGNVDDLPDMLATHVDGRSGFRLRDLRTRVIRIAIIVAAASVYFCRFRSALKRLRGGTTVGTANGTNSHG
jgi:hypothetical protein